LFVFPIFISISVSMSVFPSPYPSTNLMIYLSTYLSLYLCMYICRPTYIPRMIVIKCLCGLYYEHIVSCVYSHIHREKFMLLSSQDHSTLPCSWYYMRIDRHLFIIVSLIGTYLGVYIATFICS
jgi:hypothetical protein